MADFKLTKIELRVLRYIAEINGCIRDDLDGCFARLSEDRLAAALDTLTREGYLAKEEQGGFDVYGVTAKGRAAL